MSFLKFILRWNLIHSNERNLISPFKYFFDLIFEIEPGMSKKDMCEKQKYNQILKNNYDLKLFNSTF